MEKPNNMNISQYFRDNIDVYIRNNTSPRGVISLSLGEKGDLNHVVPKSGEPYRLTDYVTKDACEKSQSFRQLVQKGAIDLLTEEEYEDHVARTGGVSNIEKEIRRLADKQEQVEVHNPRTDEFDKEPDLNPRVMQLMLVSNLSEEEKLAMPGSNISESNVINELESLSLSQDDLAYILTQSKGEIKSWAMRKIQAVGEKEEQDVKELSADYISAAAAKETLAASEISKAIGKTPAKSLFAGKSKQKGFKKL